MQLSDRAALAQSYLFIEGGSLSMKKLSQLLGCTESETQAAISELKAAIEGSGLALAQTEREVALVTAPRVSDTIKATFEEQLQRDIGEAGLEVLATVLYRGASTRAQIDYIRGVNTSSTVRNLLSRGLLERVSNPEDSREYLYRATTELLAHLGVQTAEELPDYGTISSELAAFEKTAAPFEHNGRSNTNDVHHGGVETGDGSGNSETRSAGSGSQATTGGAENSSAHTGGEGAPNTQ
ncbi:SMC-Scp complex subunit ScpB [Candidatus Parcubacteria bacterium]|nr:MAG: SMC-Scp complex subunit ScpB [Candidatus Parcubacteria bacterium]